MGLQSHTPNNTGQISSWLNTKGLPAMSPVHKNMRKAPDSSICGPHKRERWKLKRKCIPYSFNPIISFVIYIQLSITQLFQVNSIEIES